MSDQFSSATSEATSDDKLWAGLGYLFNPLIPIIILLMEDKKNVPYLRYNAVLALAWTVVNIILGFILVGACIGPIGNIVLAVMAFQGKDIVLPFLTDFIKKQGWVN
jgi:hypothetical protein